MAAPELRARPARRLQGQFRLGDGSRCYPLTIADGCSRMLLSCRALTSTQVRESRPVFVGAFQEYGLPIRIRSDNGVPFATQALGRLSPLSVWWVRLGILPDPIEPASPQQNGRHERMHRTLKADCTRPPRPTRRLQQRRFDHWRREYNELRPHEALADATPAACYHLSPRPYPHACHRSRTRATTRSAVSAATGNPLAHPLGECQSDARRRVGRLHGDR